MIRKFIKANWFTIGLVIIIVAALLRKTVQLTQQPGQTGTVVREKFTDSHLLASGPSKAGILSDVALAPNHPMPAIEAPIAIPYLKRFGTVCSGENKKFGIPASVLLAISYLNSHAGTRPAAVNGNNFFALPCTADWPGETLNSGADCLRRYETAWASFRDFSTYLSSREWFGPTQQQCGTDWQKWIHALASRKISDVANAEAEMEKIIRTYRLFELDP